MTSRISHPDELLTAISRVFGANLMPKAESHPGNVGPANGPQMPQSYRRYGPQNGGWTDQITVEPQLSF
jgi:hypothetical protein